ncbi:hypothetical protein PENTCL1PPCAC_28171, partial [Pristionchus entomophagus]
LTFLCVIFAVSSGLPDLQRWTSATDEGYPASHSGHYLDILEDFEHGAEVEVADPEQDTELEDNEEIEIANSEDDSDLDDIVDIEDYVEKVVVDIEKDADFDLPPPPPRVPFTRRRQMRPVD